MINISSRMANFRLVKSHNYKTCFSLVRPISNSAIKLKSNESNSLKEHTNSKHNTDVDPTSKRADVASQVDRDGRQLKNTPFLKSLFCGNYIYDYLKYPEYESNKELNALNADYVQPLRNFLTQTEYGKIIDQTSGSFTRDTLQKLTSLNLHSAWLPKEYDGHELDATSLTRLVEETGIYPSMGIHLLYNNQLAARSILMYGNDKQRDKYLKRIGAGQLSAVFCHSEPDNGMDAARFSVTAKRENKNSDSFLLNGRKSWVSLLGTNSDADDFVSVVICKTIEEDQNDELKSLNAFLVDKNTPGVSIKRMLNNKNGLNLYEIELKDARVTLGENLLGTQNGGHELALNMLDNTRYMVGAVCIGLLKDLLDRTVDFCLHSKRFGKNLYEHSLIKHKISQVETKIYTMESMTYLTAGIVDSYRTPDVALESAVTKIFCTESTRTAVNDCLDILAMGAYNRLDEMRSKYLSDVNYLMNTANTNDVLRLYVSTNGVVMAGVEFGLEVGKLRNPFMYPGYMLRQLMINHRLSKSLSKKLPEYFYLWEHVHPSLGDPSGVLEQMAVKMMIAIKASLVNHGRDVIDSHINLKHLADLAMHVYAVNAVIARASRAYSIGLPNSQHEVLLAFNQAFESKDACSLIYEYIAKAKSGLNLENTKTNIADKVFDMKKHAAVHSLTRNY